MSSGIDKFMEDLSREYPRNVQLLGIDFKNLMTQFLNAGSTIGGGAALLLNAAGQTVLQTFSIQEATADTHPITQARLINDVAPVAADAQDALSRVQVVLVDPGDATPAGFANAIFIENSVTVDDAVRYSTQDDLDILSTTGFNSITNNNWRVITDDGNRANNLYLVFCGGTSAIENNTASLSTVIRRDITGSPTGVQVSGAIHFRSVGWTSEFCRLFVAAGATAAGTLRFNGATNKIELRDANVTRYTSTFTVAAGDTVQFSLWQNTVTGTMYARFWRNIDPNVTPTPTEDSGIQTGVGGSAAFSDVRWGFLTAASGTSAVMGPVDVSKQLTVDIGSPSIDNPSDVHTNLLRRVRQLEKTTTAVRTTDRAPFNNTTALAADGVLTVPVVANKKYIVDGVVFYDSSTIADLKVQLDAPSGATLNYAATSLQSAAAGSAATVNMQQRNAGLAFVAGGVGNGAGNIVSMPFSGTLIMGTTSGNLAFSFAQQTLDITDTIIRAGSYIRVKEFV